MTKESFWVELQQAIDPSRCDQICQDIQDAADQVFPPDQGDQGGQGEIEINIHSEVAKYATYPWDKCVSDRQAEGHSKDSADAICAAIKNRTVKHALEQGLVKTFEEGVALVSQRFSEDSLFRYLALQLNACAKKKP